MNLNLAIFVCLIIIAYWFVEREFGLVSDIASTVRDTHFSRKVRALVEEHEPSVFALPLEEARIQAEQILLEGKGWKCRILVGPPEPDILLLAASLRELFTRWEEIKKDADTSLLFCGDDWLPSTAENAFMPNQRGPFCISGTVDEQESLWVLPGEEEIHEVVLYSAARVQGEEKIYPSIWHWIIMKNIEKEILRTLRQN